MLREARPAGGRGDRPSLDQQGAREGAAEGRGAQLRHPQEHPEVRQRHERPAQGRSSSAAAKSWREESVEEQVADMRDGSRRRPGRAAHSARTPMPRPGTSRASPRTSSAKLNLDAAGRRLGEGRRHRRRGDARSACSTPPTRPMPSASRSNTRRLMRMIEKQVVLQSLDHAVARASRRARSSAPGHRLARHGAARSAQRI